MQSTVTEDFFLLREEAMNVVEHALLEEEISIEKYEELIQYLRQVGVGERIVLVLS